MSRSAQELSLSGTAQKPISIHHDTTSGEHDVGHSRNLNAFEHRVVHSHVVSLGADRVFTGMIKDHQVSIAANCDRSLAWIQAKKPCRSGRDQLHETVRAKPPLDNSARVNQAHA